VAVVVAARLVALPGGEEPEAAPGPPLAVDEDLVLPDPPVPSPTESPTTQHPVVDGDAAVFSERTGTVLLFDGGGETGLAVHLDSGARRRVPLPGQRAGDQPFRLWRMGREVVVGWGEVHAVTPADGASRHLGSATIFLPAAEPDRLWLIDHSGGAVGSGAATWTLIDASGEQLHRVEMPLTGLDPVRGLPGGLAVRTPSGGLARYAVETRDLTDIPGAAWIGDVSADFYAWCRTDTCPAPLSVSDASGEPYAGLGPSGEEFSPGAVWLSPDGSHLAAWVRVSVGDGVDLRLRVYDVTTGQVRADEQTVLGNIYGQWSEDGKQFFFRFHASGGADAPSVLGRWAGGESVEQVNVRELGLDGVYGFVALPEAAVGVLLEVPEAG
jgi:hypothetical protein